LFALIVFRGRITRDCIVTWRGFLFRAWLKLEFQPLGFEALIIQGSEKMTNADIIKFVNENPKFVLATCVGNEPRVRIMELYRADEHGLVFNTSKRKSLYRQLRSNPAVEMCFYDAEGDTQMRIRGVAQEVVDYELRSEMAAKNPVLASVVLNDGPDSLVVYRLMAGKVKVWQMDEEFVPILKADLELSSIWMALYKGAGAHCIL
jgi:pyridoxamine 5'-phosphate oxidase